MNIPDLLIIVTAFIFGFFIIFKVIRESNISNKATTDLENISKLHKFKYQPGLQLLKTGGIYDDTVAYDLVNGILSNTNNMFWYYRQLVQARRYTGISQRNVSIYVIRVEIPDTKMRAILDSTKNNPNDYTRTIDLYKSLKATQTVASSSSIFSIFSSKQDVAVTQKILNTQFLMEAEQHFSQLDIEIFNNALYFYAYEMPKPDTLIGILSDIDSLITHSKLAISNKSTSSFTPPVDELVSATISRRSLFRYLLLLTCGIFIIMSVIFFIKINLLYLAVIITVISCLSPILIPTYNKWRSKKK